MYVSASRGATPNRNLEIKRLTAIEAGTPMAIPRNTNRSPSRHQSENIRWICSQRHPDAYLWSPHSSLIGDQPVESRERNRQSQNTKGPERERDCLVRSHGECKLIFHSLGIEHWQADIVRLNLLRQTD